MSGLANEPKKFAVIGELNVDLVVIGSQGTAVPGRETIAEDISLTLGSASAIVACGLARLGNDVTFVSRVGKDDFGRFCLKALEGRGIRTDQVNVAEGSKTGVTIALSTGDDRALVTFPGAIAELRYADIPLNILEGKDHLHLTSYYLQSALRPDFPRLLDQAKRLGLTNSFDPNTDPKQGRDSKIFDVLEFTDVLFLNEPESLLLSGAGDAESAARKLSGYCPMVVIKLGPAGSIAVQDGELTRSDGFKVDVVDTTGAGDSFAAGFLHAYHLGAAIGDCLQIANACGALSTRMPGGTDAQPSVAEIRGFLKSRESSAAGT